MLPQLFTRADEDADYRWQLSVKQAEFSTTMALDRPPGRARLSSSSSSATTWTSVARTR